LLAVTSSVFELEDVESAVVKSCSAELFVPLIETPLSFQVKLQPVEAAA
jgi:hypothetical protein